METIDLERLGVKAEASLPKKEKLLPRHRQGEKFLKGPIPWDWLTKAAQLPGHALHVALVLWRV